MEEEYEESELINIDTVPEELETIFEEDELRQNTFKAKGSRNEEQFHDVWPDVWPDVLRSKLEHMDRQQNLMAEKQKIEKKLISEHIENDDVTNLKYWTTLC